MKFVQIWELMGDHTGSDCLSAALDHGAYTANGIASYVSSSGDTAGQHAHGGVLDVIRDEARHFRIYAIRCSNFKKSNKRARSRKM